MVALATLVALQQYLRTHPLSTLSHRKPTHPYPPHTAGKKINLSLSEMAQFFMKMAEAVIKKKLTPGTALQIIHCSCHCHYCNCHVFVSFLLLPLLVF